MKSTASAIPTTPSRTTDLVTLAKPRLNLLVVVSAVAGYVMASGDTRDVWRLLFMIVGTALVAGGASAFNQILERDPDALMQRTRLRPLPDGRLQMREAWVFGGVLLAGLAILAVGVNLLSAIVALVTVARYALVYTPLKRYYVILDGDRRDSRCASPGHRLGRGARRAVPGRVGPVRDRVFVAVAALSLDRVAVP